MYLGEGIHFPLSPLPTPLIYRPVYSPTPHNNARCVDYHPRCENETYWFYLQRQGSSNYYTTALMMYHNYYNEVFIVPALRVCSAVMT